VPVQDINEFLQIVERGGRRLVRCQCGEVLGPAAGNYKDHLAVYEGPCSGSGPHTLTLVAEPRFVYREFYCPSCFLLLDVEVVERGAAVEQDVEFRA
jgi:acetone carboxylase gamma subunit